MRKEYGKPILEVVEFEYDVSTHSVGSVILTCQIQTGGIMRKLNKVFNVLMLAICASFLLVMFKG